MNDKKEKTQSQAQMEVATLAAFLIEKTNIPPAKVYGVAGRFRNRYTYFITYKALENLRDIKYIKEPIPYLQEILKRDFAFVNREKSKEVIETLAQVWAVK